MKTKIKNVPVSNKPSKLVVPSKIQKFKWTFNLIGKAHMKTIIGVLDIDSLSWLMLRCKNALNQTNNIKGV